MASPMMTAPITMANGAFRPAALLWRSRRRRARIASRSRSRLFGGMAITNDRAEVLICEYRGDEVEVPPQLLAFLGGQRRQAVAHAGQQQGVGLNGAKDTELH